MKKTFKIGIYSIILSVAVVAIAVIINLAVSKLIPEKYTKFDTSAVKLFTLSDETVSFVSSINMPITIYHVCENGSEDFRITALLGSYRAANPLITVKTIDPVVNSAFITENMTEGLENGSLIIESERRSRVVLRREIIIEQYYIEGTTEQDMQVKTQNYFAGENAITSALNYVTTDSLPVVYCLSGYGQNTLDTTLAAYVNSKNIELKTLDLFLAGQVPDDCDTLMLINPKSDLTERDRGIIKKYLADGGRLMLVTRYLVSAQAPNILSIVGDFGASLVDGILLDSGMGAYYENYLRLLPKIEESDVAAGVRSEGYSVLLYDAQGINVSKEPPQGIKIQSLLTTSASSYVKSGSNVKTVEKEEADKAGPFSAAISAENAAGGRLIWFASPMIIDSEADKNTNYSNSAYFLSALSILCGKTDSAEIPTILMKVEPLIIPNTVGIILSIIIVGVIPAAFIITGCVIFIKRRNS